MKHIVFENNILAYIDNELSTEEKSSFEKHLSTCEKCASLYKKIEKDYSKLNEAAPELDSFFYTRLQAKMEASSNSKQKTLSGWAVMKIAASFALMISLGVVAGNMYSSESTSASDTSEMKLMADAYSIDYETYSIEEE